LLPLLLLLLLLLLLCFFVVWSGASFACFYVDKCEHISDTPEQAQRGQSDTPVKVLG
jgi:hypothetical protein